MKQMVVFVALCVFLFSGAASVKADESADLKKQINDLQDTITAQQQIIDGLKSRMEKLEKKQVSQAKEIKKVPELAETVQNLKEAPSSGLTEGVQVGGHLKMYMFDRTGGERNNVDQNNGLSAGLNHAYLYLSKEISDFLNIEIATDTSVRASATPSLGSDISRATSGSVSTSVHTATMEVLLPQGVELKVGKFNPMFCEEYAKETWWHEQYHGNKGLLYLESWHDVGIEAYKSFDLENWTLPVYLSYLNGGTNQYIDNNKEKTVLFHVAPEFLQGSLRGLGSFGIGKWDDDDKKNLMRCAAGAEWLYQNLSLSGEYLYNEWENRTLTGGGETDATREGYYAKAKYQFSPEWQALVKFSHSKLYNTAASSLRTDTYDALSLGLNYEIWEASTIMAQLALVDADRSDGSEKLEYTRFTLGWRTTF